MSVNARNIVLVGFMGTGKTQVGKRLAERLELRFVDMDDVLVERAGKPIPRIFEEDGEAWFREMERRLVQDLSAERGLVIATGGGVVLNSDNIRDFGTSGLVVCLSARPETILERVTKDDNRPLLAGDKAKRIASLLSARQPLYDAIKHQVDTDDLTLDEGVERIARLF